MARMGASADVVRRRAFHREPEAVSVRVDERTVTGKYRTLGFLGPKSSSFTLAWLATHRDRLRTLVAGGKRLSVLVIWDTQGARQLHHDEDEVEAMRRIVYGPENTGSQKP